MIERFTDVFTKGTKMTFKNPVLFLPYLIYFALILILIGISFAAAFLGEEAALILIFLYIPAAFIIALVEYFIRIGLLGMSKDVALTGKTSFSQLFQYGKKYFIRVLGIGLITFAVAAIGYVLVIFAFYIGFFMIVFQGLDYPDASSLSTGTIAALILVAAVGLIWVFVTQLFFYFARYAAVADDLPFENAIRQSFSLFKENKFKVFSFVLLASILVYIPNLLLNVISYFSSYMPEFSESGGQTGLAVLIIAAIAAGLLMLVFSALIPVWATNMYLWLANKENVTLETDVNKTNETVIEYNEQEISFD